MKWIIVSVCILTLLSCGSGTSKTPYADSLACTHASKDFDSTTFVDTSNSLKIQLFKKSANPPSLTTVLIHEMKGYDQDTTFARQAAKLLETLINSDEFKNSVVGNTYNEDNGNTPQQIYDLIKNAHEPVGPGGQDHVIDLYLRVISLEEDGQEWIDNCEPNSTAGTIGIDGAGSGIAAICPQWLRIYAQKRKPSWLAAHFIHEYMHVLGFKHNHSKPKSVPYKIQFIVERLGAQYDPQ